jgi:hypothetical protein
MTDPTRETAVSAAEANPIANDLEVIRKRYCTGDSFQGGSICVGDINGLIVEVEALREQVTELESDNAAAIKWQQFYMKKAEATQAHATELAVALEAVRQTCLFADDDAGPIGVTTDPHISEALFKNICTVLATLPAEALEGARLMGEIIKASDAVIDSGARLRSDPGNHELALANLCGVMGQLAKLDAPPEDTGT